MHVWYSKNFNKMPLRVYRFTKMTRCFKKFENSPLYCFYILYFVFFEGTFAFYDVISWCHHVTSYKKKKICF